MNKILLVATAMFAMFATSCLDDETETSEVRQETEVCYRTDCPVDTFAGQAICQALCGTGGTCFANSLADGGGVCGVNIHLP